MKKKILIGILAWVAFWPLAHFGLARTLDANPWRFFGFAKYATPPSYLTIMLEEGTEGTTSELSPSELSVATQRKYLEFGHRRSTLGKIYQPGRLAQAILDERPDEVESLRVILMQRTVDNSTAIVVENQVGEYFYVRD